MLFTFHVTFVQTLRPIFIKGNATTHLYTYEKSDCIKEDIKQKRETDTRFNLALSKCVLKKFKVINDMHVNCLKYQYLH